LVWIIGSIGFFWSAYTPIIVCQISDPDLELLELHEVYLLESLLWKIYEGIPALSFDDCVDIHWFWNLLFLVSQDIVFPRCLCKVFTEERQVWILWILVLYWICCLLLQMMISELLYCKFLVQWIWVDFSIMVSIPHDFRYIMCCIFRLWFGVFLPQFIEHFNALAVLLIVVIDMFVAACIWRSMSVLCRNEAYLVSWFFKWMLWLFPCMNADLVGH
jgi:hypothetical protein